MQNLKQFALDQLHLDQCLNQCEANNFVEFRKEDLKILNNKLFLNTPNFVRELFKECVQSSRELRPKFKEVIFIKYIIYTKWIDFKSTFFFL